VAKVVVSNSELTELLWRKIRTFPECRTRGVPIAIVPDDRFGWMALTAPYVVRRFPLMAKRVEEAQMALRKIYALKGR
jgi:hypothetical protein